MAGAGADLDLGHEDEVLGGGVGLEQVVEAFAQGALVARAAVADQPLDIGVVLIDLLHGHGAPSKNQNAAQTSAGELRVQCTRYQSLRQPCDAADWGKR